MTLGLLLTAFGLGLRHGIDWDHIAAISDLTGSSESRRQGWWLSLWYAVGHGIAVFALGVVAIAVGAAIPEGLDRWMGAVVGVTLVLLGAWLLYDVSRRGQDFRLRSRWMLVIDGTFRGLRRVRMDKGGRTIEVEHQHEHRHDGDLAHDEVVAHDHAHLEVGADAEALVRASAGSPSAHTGHAHSHRHTHQTVLPGTATAGTGSAAGIGVLHGIGIESPTQIAIFVASTSAVGTAAGISLLGAWVAGLIVANAGLAVAASWILVRPAAAAKFHRVLACVVAALSIGLGAFYITSSL